MSRNALSIKPSNTVMALQVFIAVYMNTMFLMNIDYDGIMEYGISS